MDRTQTLGSEAFEWGGSTRPFYDDTGVEPARFVLEQVEDEKFASSRTSCTSPSGAIPCMSRVPHSARPTSRRSPRTCRGS